MPPMRRIAVTNQKGGSGKTTTVVNLAAALGEHKQRVLVIDLDPQANASEWLGCMDGGRDLLDTLTNNVNLADIVRNTDVPGVSLIPSSAWMAGADRALANEVGAETLFRRKLDKLTSQWDVCLIDCPPALNLLTVSALVACNRVLVPVEASTLALRGLAALTETIAKVTERLNRKLTIDAVLACRVDRRRSLARDVVTELHERLGKLVLKTEIRENVRLTESPSFSQPITIYAPTSNGAQDYRDAAAELLQRWKQKGSKRA